MGTVHQVHKRQVIQRFDEVDVSNASQQAVDRLAHIGVKVYGVDDVHLRKCLGRGGQRLTDAFKPVAKTFAPVAGDKHDTPFRV
ncbi:MAG: hypothetical protein ACD_23C00945G0004 [uncultured bacterium]|nr:MAG: hypothetical protein ACD_23C00945G0004 [uncultured bacterium]